MLHILFQCRETSTAVNFHHKQSSKQTFQEAFGISTAPTEYSNSKTRLTPSNANVHVDDSLFKDCKSSSSGGAVYCSGSSVAKLLISQSSFTSCKTSNDAAGAIYYANEDSGQCVICEICGFKGVLLLTFSRPLSNAENSNFRVRMT